MRGSYVRAENGSVVTFENIPLLKCDDCSADELPTALEPYVRDVVDGARAKGYGSAKWKCNFDQVTPERMVRPAVNFIFDTNDYYMLPGLALPQDDGYLTPLFFDIKSLDKYAGDDDYHMEIVSETMGSIYGKEGFLITFGINKSDRVVMWLGDLTDLAVNDQHYWRSYNVESDHDIASDFYDAQIMAVFTEPSREQLLLQAHTKLNSVSRAKLGEDLMRVDAEAFINARQVHRPTLFKRSNLCRNIAALNKLLVEAVNTRLARSALKVKDPSADVSDLKGNKLLQALLATEFGEDDASTAAMGLFVLYDWRITCEHALGDESLEAKLRSCAERLGLSLDPIDDEAGLRQMYEELLRSLVVACERLTAAVTSF